MDQKVTNQDHFDQIKAHHLSRISSVVAALLLIPMVQFLVQSKWSAAGVTFVALVTLVLFAVFLKKRGIYNIGALLFGLFLGGIVFFRSLQGGGIEASSSYWFIGVVASGFVFLQKRPLIMLLSFVFISCTVLFLVTSGSIPNPVPVSSDPLFNRFFDTVCNFAVVGALFYIHNRIFKEQMELIREQENALLLQSRLKSMGEMAAGIAHEVNNPLAIIFGKTEQIDDALLSEEINRDEITACTEKIAQTVTRVTTIMKSLKKLSHGKLDGDLEAISMSDMISDIKNIVGSKAKNLGVDIQFETEDNAWALGSQTLLGQVLINLVTNSFQAIEPLSEKWVSVRLESHDSKIIIRVRDSGSGISNEVAQKIFNPFFTTKTVGEGTGLGLALCKTAITRMNGDLYVNQECKNTEFVIELENARKKEPNKLSA